MRHVFVETNWVVDWAAPAHHQDTKAAQLLADAAAGRHRMYLPSICLTEARPPLAERFTPRLAPVRGFLKWVTRQSQVGLTISEVETTRKALEVYENAIADAQDSLGARLAGLHSAPGLEVFPLDEEMLSRAVALTSESLQLKPFDQAILAGILVRAERLASAGERDFALCELDADLQPWSKDSRKETSRKEPLASLYDRAGIWVYGDFELRFPAPYDGWPGVVSAAGS